MSTPRENHYIMVSSFRTRFNKLCEESEKTIMELAKDLHVSNQTISAWRLGVRSPKEPTIIAIADHFNVTVPWLMGYNCEKHKHNQQEEPQPVPDNVRILMKGMTKLPPDKQAQLLNVARAMFAEYADYFKGDDNATRS